MRVLCVIVSVIFVALVSTSSSTSASVSSESSGTIQDMEHIVIFMQENRAFDHYYGVLNGVRGFNDRSAPPLPNGRSVFAQPISTSNDSYMLPFPLYFTNTSTQCMPAPEMAYPSDTNIFNGGWMDAWNTARSPGYGMSHFNREDLPWYYALADAFTIGDQYFQSTFTATNPNRMHLFSGSNGLSVPNSGFCCLNDNEPTPGFGWPTMAETLQASNISWRVLQELDNFDDNAFEWFESFKTAKIGSPLFNKGIMPVANIVESFEDLLKTDTLPQVTWIVGPTDLSEHAQHHPGDGEWLTSEFVRVLSKPEYASVYAKTAFILNYDEGGQFVDHVWTPTPPRSAEDGKSTVTTAGELTIKEFESIPPGHPIGLGFRVPMVLISPWTRGHKVYSEVSDHTSVIKLIEQRFGVHCPNISPWRRAIVSDLTAAFDWQNPDYSWPASFPSTSKNLNQSQWECSNLPSPTIPTKQSMPVQEPGVRTSMPLPYEFVISAHSIDRQIQVTMKNSGTAGGAFQVYNWLNTSAVPKKYTVEAGKSLSDEWSLVDTPSSAAYNLSLYGINGFVRKFAGSTAALNTLQSTFEYDKVNAAVVVSVSTSQGKCGFKLVDNAYGGGSWNLVATASGSSMASQSISVKSSGNWYDLTLTLVASSECPVTGFERTFMGRMENGQPTTSDPAMATGESIIFPLDMQHPDLPSHLAYAPWVDGKECGSRRSQMKDVCWTNDETEQLIESHKQRLRDEL
jgi:phospholipase C